MMHRADPWEELFRLATSGDVEGQVAEVRFGVEVVGVDVEGGDVELASGEVVESEGTFA